MAPEQNWRHSACNLGLLVQTLQACEQALRAHGLQQEGDALHHILLEFLSSRRGTVLRGSEPELETPGPRQPLPVRRSAKRRGRVPGRRYYVPTPEQP